MRWGWNTIFITAVCVVFSACICVTNNVINFFSLFFIILWLEIFDYLAGVFVISLNIKKANKANSSVHPR